MKLYKFIFSSLLFLCLFACSNSSPDSALETENKAAKLIFSIETTGGCMMMGPNCPRYELMRDGSFMVHRGDASEVSRTGKIEQTLVDNWMALIRDTNFKELQSRLGDGECRACFDGIDFTYSVFKNEMAIVLNSRELEFSQLEAFFILSEQIRRAMSVAAPLELKTRN